MRLSEIQAPGILKSLKLVDGIGSGLDSDLIRGANPYLANKNKIINGDMQVTQRGRMHKLENDGDHTADRWYSEIQSGSEEVRQEFLHSPDAGSWKDEKDPFGDGSQHNLWQLDGDAKDTNGNNDGTLHGDADFIDDVLPNIGSCKVLTLDGDGDYVSTDFKIDDSKQYTLSAWFKTTDNNGTILLSRDSNDTNEKTRGTLNFDLGYLRLWQGDDDNYDSVNITLPYKFDDNVWHHLLVSIDKYNQTIYFDGKKIGTYTLSISAGTASDYTYSIGRNGEADAHYFKGQIARVRVFLGKALNEDEVRKIYVEDSKYIFKNHLKSIVTKDNDISKYTPFVYRFEGQDIAPYIAKQEKMTLSFDFASNSNRDFTLKVNYPDGSEFKSYTFSYNGDKDFQKISQVIDFNDFDLTKLIVDENLGLELQIVNNTDVDAADYIKVTNVQLEEGDVATEFERISYAKQLDNILAYNLNKTTINAFVNFSMSSGEIRQAYNVSSVQKLGDGHWQVNYTNPLDNANYIGLATTQNTYFGACDSFTVNKCRVIARDSDGNAKDVDLMSVAIFGGKE